MYVDETGADTTDTTADDAGHDELTVEVGGEGYEVQENYDYDQDGHNDTAVVQTEEGYMAFTDTDGDGTADTMVELDQDGNVTAAAEYSEASGEWTEAEAGSVHNPSGDGADDGHGTGHTAPSNDDDSNTHTTTHTSGGGDDITVDTKDGDVAAGAAEYDADGDGKNDTAVTTDQQGNTYAFTDSDGDGEADEAIVIEADGDVTVAQHTGEDEWTTVETGHIGADGSYSSDSTAAAPASGSDSAWTS
ncbi:hypothetical protein [Actinokineospora sp. NBRC 105648]|uniref:hypothetical protein n=1 Tax=Actinokineospora sp. NBRC 105648 TaxID=3032206 RepID=UPI0024A3F028|nr:hypothetical protein [Actinokineospora sp. NBRC 105648]GLZ37469.1 hypothetical protein Acsp05_10940 [Actinokineospora sp. NBRC 105648]